MITLQPMNHVTDLDLSTGGAGAAAVLRHSFVRHVEYHRELASTNRTAAELLRPLIERSPALVVTAQQTAGRGRKGSPWWSSAGALTFSLVLDPARLAVPPDRRPMLALAAGLAVRQAIAEHLTPHDVRVKWPNDVIVSHRKICGILTEQHAAGGCSGLITGIGINVNNSLSLAPDDIRHRATSMSDIQQRSFDLVEILIGILQQLERRIEELAARPASLIAELNDWHCLNGCLVTLQSGDRCIEGVCEGVDETGNLVVQTGSERQRFPSGAVTSWSPVGHGVGLPASGLPGQAS